MARVILGNHTAIFAARSEQQRIRGFYCEVLGCTPRVKSNEVDRFQLDGVHFSFVYQDTALDERDFLKAIYLELKTDNTEEMKQKILAFGVGNSMCRIRTFISKLQAGGCLSSWASTKTYLRMRIRLHRGLDHPHRHHKIHVKIMSGLAPFKR
jgi:hypothetical protein